jgi:hypothetical protein
MAEWVSSRYLRRIGLVQGWVQKPLMLGCIYGVQEEGIASALSSTPRYSKLKYTSSRHV